MFLIEFRKGQFIDGKTIQWLCVDGVVKFSVLGDASVWNVDPEYEATFINNLQAINDNVNVEACYHKIKKETVDD